MEILGCGECQSAVLNVGITMSAINRTNVALSATTTQVVNVSIQKWNLTKS